MYDAVIAGAGPAGSSAAIHLALSGARVLLVEQKKFPRAKLCGEFISPECLNHFARLGVSDQMMSAGGECLSQTVFYSRSGRSVDVPSEWFDHQKGALALGLSRAEMDQRLLERARAAGVDVLEETQVTGLIQTGPRVCGVQLRSTQAVNEAHARVVIDATGRTRALARRLNGPQKQDHRERARLVAFKAHFENARPAPATCEIYFYPGGYGGLSSIENGLANLCFITAASDVRACQADPETVLRKIVSRNSRAAYCLAEATVSGEWLAVSLESFGRQEPAPNAGLIMVGDAAAFIDPFTGSGMLMALESGELAARAIVQHLQTLRNNGPFDVFARDYRRRYRQQFAARLRVSAMLRRAAFVPRLAELAMRFFGVSKSLRRSLAHATRKA